MNDKTQAEAEQREWLEQYRARREGSAMGRGRFAGQEPPVIINGTEPIVKPPIASPAPGADWALVNEPEFLGFSVDDDLGEGISNAPVPPSEEGEGKR